MIVALSVLVLLSAVCFCVRMRFVRMQRETAELREKLNTQIMEQKQMAENYNMRSRLMYKFVEELYSPLSLIIASLKDMSDEKDLPMELLPKLQVAYRNSLGILEVCKQMKAICGYELRDDVLKVSPYSMDWLSEGVLREMADLIQMNHMDFRCDSKLGKNHELWGDRSQIAFVLRNLIFNAFMHVNYSGSVRLRMYEALRNGVRYCVLAVEDNGKTPVDQADTVLGYGVVEKIVVSHHGFLKLRNKDGGAEATVELPMGKEAFEQDGRVKFMPVSANNPPQAFPVKPVPADTRKVSLPEEGIRMLEKEIPPSSEKRATLLVVDDNKDIRLYLKVLFRKEYDLLFAVNGQEGVDMALEHVPDLVLCDVMMPVKDGFACCTEVKENPETCHIPFIMLTARVEDGDVLKGLELGADDYVLKPFTPAILKAKVANLINVRRNLRKFYAGLLMPPDTEGADMATAGGAQTSDEAADTPELVQDTKIRDPFVARVVKIVEENLSDSEFGVNQLASMLNTSQPTLYRKVKLSTDFTVVELIRRVRMRKAAVLLKQKVYSVQEVAEMVGYNDVPTFRKHFVNLFDATPSAYSNSVDKG